jgi:uncharacterized protein
MENIEIKVKVPKTLKDPVLLVGLPGIGFVGKICVEYLSTKIEAKEIGEMFGSNFPPIVAVDNKGKISFIKNYIYHYNTKKQDLFFLVGDIQPPLDLRNNPQHFQFASAVVKLARKLRVKEIYTFAGIDIGDKRITSKPKIKFATNDYKNQKELLNEKIKAAHEELTISGAAGAVIGLANEDKIPGTCILTETSSKLIYGDFEAAKETVKYLAKKFDLKVNLKELEKEAKVIVDAFKQVTKELKNISKQYNEKPENVTYVR